MAYAPQPSLSPPATPPKQRKRKPDPFLQLSAEPIPSASASPDPAQQDASQRHDDEPILKKIILTPLLFSSFIFSLFLVNRRNRAYRLAEHPPARSPSSFWSRWSPWQWRDPEPYQDPADSTWRNDDARKATGSDGSVPGVDGQARINRKRWFFGKKHRKMAKLELDEAFDMRWKVMMAVGITWGLGMLSLFWAAKKLMTGW